MSMDLTARLRVKDEGASSALRRHSDLLKKVANSVLSLERMTKELSSTEKTAQKVAAGMGSEMTDMARSMSVAERMTSELRSSTRGLRNDLGQLATTGRRAGNSFDGIVSGAAKAKGAVLGLKSAIGGMMGVAAGYGIYRGAESFLSSAIGGAAQHELATVQIEALFRDEKKAKTYMARMSEAAALSPILNEQQVFQNSKSFLALTKDQSVLEDLWKAAEKMNAMDPLQGLEGAVLAIRELSGGDVQSMVERFELPRSVVNQWKNLPIEKQAKAINKYMDSIGFDQQFLEKTGATAAKQWDRTTELIQKGTRRIGQDTLTRLKPVLVEVNDFLSGPRFDDFVNKAGRAMSGMFDGLIAGGREAMRYLDSHYFNNPNFNRLTTIQSKVAFVVDDLTKTFSDWYDTKGSEQLKSATRRVTNTILDGLETAGPEIGKSAVSIGARIASGMIDGLFEGLDKNPVGKLILKAPVFDSMKWGLDVKDAAVGAIKGTPVVENNKMMMMNPLKTLDAFKEFRNPVPRVYGPNIPQASEGPEKPAYHGLEYVPRDGFRTRLHKGERVLTAQENREYSSGGGKSGGKPFVINIASMSVREEADIERIAYQLARAINEVR